MTQYIFLIEGNYIDPNSGAIQKIKGIRNLRWSNHMPGTNRQCEQKCFILQMLAKMLYRVKRKDFKNLLLFKEDNTRRLKRFQMYQRHILGHLRK